MYSIEHHKYFTGQFNFLLHKEDGRINFKNLLYYILAISAIVTIGQLYVSNSEPYKSDNMTNEKFISAEIKKQVITDTIILQKRQTYFKSYLVIKLAKDLSYRINLAERDYTGKITKNATIEKKANSKIFEIVNKNIRYTFEIEELSNYRERIFVFFGTILISFWAIPGIIRKNELEKEYEKNHF